MEPLLGSDNEDRGSIEFKPVSATTTKDHFPITSAAARRSETWGRARLVIVTLVAFLLIYVSIASSGIELPQVVIVHVPPDENPGMSQMSVGRVRIKIVFMLLYLLSPCPYQFLFLLASYHPHNNQPSARASVDFHSPPKHDQIHHPYAYASWY